MKMVTRKFFLKNNKYPPLKIPEDNIYKPLIQAIKKNIWMENEKAITLQEWAKVEFKQWLNYHNFDYDPSFLKDVGVAWEGD